MKAQVYAKRKKNFNNINNEIYIISLKKKKKSILLYIKSLIRGLTDLIVFFVSFSLAYLIK